MRKLSPVPAVVLALLTILVVVPLAQLAWTVVTTDRAALARALRGPDVVSAAIDTLLLATVVTVVAVPLGAVLALTLRRPDVPGRRGLSLMVVVPVLVPPFVLGHSWTQAYGRAGFTDSILGVHWSGVLGPVGVAVVLVVGAVPIGYLLTVAGLVSRDEPDLTRAARVSGARGTSAFATITLPLLRPALAAAAVLVFVGTLESFAVPQVLGAPAGFDTLTTRIYADLAMSSSPAAFVEAVTIALLLVTLAALLVLPADIMLGPRLRVERLGDPAGAPSATPTSRTGKLLAWSIGGYLVLAVGLPSVALLATAVTRAVGLPPVPSNWTFDHFRIALDPGTVTAFGRSAMLAAVAATLLVPLGGLIAVLERRSASLSGRALGTALMLTFVLPGSTLAVGMLIAYGRWIGGTLTIILLAYLGKLWAFAHRPVAGGLDRLPSAELHAARASGAGALTTVRTIALRALAPVLVGGWLLVFTTALYEVTMSSLLHGPRSRTLAVVVLDSQELGRIGETSALSVVLTLALLLPVALLWLVLRRRPGRESAVPSRPSRPSRKAVTAHGARAE